MPNGTPDVSGGAIQSAELEIPGVPAEATSFRALGETIVDFFSGLFGGGGSGFRVVQTEAQRDERIAIARAQKAAEPTFFGGTSLADVVAGAGSPLSRITGRAPIPTPARGGPPLVTERFADLPGPFVEEELGIMPFELRAIPEPPTEIFPFQPRQIPEPDVLEEPMAVDAPLLAGVGGLPAILQRTTPIVGGVLGGLAQDIVSGFLRAPQEMGLGTVQVPARVTGCPPAAGEKPSTRILRFVKQQTGVSVSLSRAKSLIRELGLENAARCLGLNAQQVCALLIAAAPRRRRGISASDIRIVKRTARRFESLKHALSHVGGRAAPHAHRRRRHHHAHSHK